MKTKTLKKMKMQDALDIICLFYAYEKKENK